MLQWTCKEIVAQRVLEGKEQVSLSELDLSSLPDEVIDTDVSSLRKYIDKIAWKHLLQSSKLLRFMLHNSLGLQYISNHSNNTVVASNHSVLCSTCQTQWVDLLCLYGNYYKKEHDTVWCLRHVVPLVSSENTLSRCVTVSLTETFFRHSGLVWTSKRHQQEVGIALRA